MLTPGDRQKSGPMARSTFFACDASYTESQRLIQKHTMTMKIASKFLLAALLLSAAGHAIAKPAPVTKAYSVEVQDRHLSGFHAVDVAGSFDVYITQGSTVSVKVEAPSELMKNIKTEVEGGTLRIYNKDENGFHWGDLFGHHPKVRIYVDIKDVDAVAVSGSGDVYFKEGLHAGNLHLSVLCS